MESFSNPIGRDYNEIKNGCSMILDPFEDIVTEMPVVRNFMRISSVNRMSPIKRLHG